jgi:hypothetical protein
MTKKDCELIAQALRNAGQLQSALSPNVVACQYVADALARDNPKFNRAKFIAACGVLE